MYLLLRLVNNVVCPFVWPVIFWTYRRDHRWMILWCNSHYLSAWRCVSILKYMELLYNVVWRLLFGWCLKTDFRWMPWEWHLLALYFIFVEVENALSVEVVSVPVCIPSTPSTVMRRDCLHSLWLAGCGMNHSFESGAVALNALMKELKTFVKNIVEVKRLYQWGIPSVESLVANPNFKKMRPLC